MPLESVNLKMFTIFTSSEVTILSPKHKHVSGLVETFKTKRFSMSICFGCGIFLTLKHLFSHSNAWAKDEWNWKDIHLVRLIAKYLWINLVHYELFDRLRLLSDWMWSIVIKVIILSILVIASIRCKMDDKQQPLRLPKCKSAFKNVIAIMINFF